MKRARIPGSKRGKVSHAGIEFVARIDVAKWLETGPAYTGYDPFSGDWSLYGTFQDISIAREKASWMRSGRGYCYP